MKGLLDEEFCYLDFMNSKETVGLSVEAVLRKWLEFVLSKLSNKELQKKPFWFVQLETEPNSRASVSPQYVEIMKTEELHPILFGNSEFLEVEKQLSNDPLIRKHIEEEIICFHVKEHLNIVDLVKWFLETYLISSKYQPRYDENIFNEAIGIFRHFFESSELNLRFLATAMNCVSNQQIEADLENPYGILKVRTRNLDEIKSLLQSVKTLLKCYQKAEYEIPQFTITMYNVTVDLLIKVKKTFVTAKQEVEDKTVSETYTEGVKCLELVECCLRLIYSQWLAFGPLFMWIENAPFSEYSQIEFSRSLLPSHDLLDVPSNLILKDDVDLIKSRWKNVWEGTDGSSLIDTALKRYSFSYDRKSSEDRLIDLMVAFEALFLADASDELAYRLATRVASLLGDSSIKKKEMFDFMRDAYKLRSRIVHGGEYDQEKLSKILPTAQDVLRDSLDKIFDDDLVLKLKKSEYWDSLLFT